MTSYHPEGMEVAVDWASVHGVEPEGWSGLTAPLGARWCSTGVTFAVYSSQATRVLVELFDRAVGASARLAFELRRNVDGVFRCRIAGLPVGALYGYRCWGPNWPFVRGWVAGTVTGFITDVDGEGNRFNPNKLLLDPYARELSHDRETPELVSLGHHAEMYGSGAGLYTGFGHPPVVRRVFDTAPFAPKSVVVDDRTATGARPLLPQKDSIIYETHVRGLTQHPSASRLAAILANEPPFRDVRSVPAEYRGTYRGAAYMAPYLKALGVTTVEFLPVQEAANDINTREPPADRSVFEPPHGNYWGYMTYGYFAPDRRYAFDKSPGGPTREFKEMVRAFHDQGLEVYLDVVFNHSAEGGLWNNDPSTAEILCFRGLDNVTYYALTGEGKRDYWESTGCGNNLNCSNPAVQKFIVDCLLYWTTDMGVDGYRFDLATVLGRDELFSYEFRAGAPLLREIADIAQQCDIEVVAEAWDTGAYNLGEFPKGWAEWNGRYRDVIRRFCRGEPGLTREFADVANGDYTHFVDQGGPRKSVNFIVAHDGFTLLDLVSYNTKQNGHTWPFGPSDGGSDDNLAWDSGGSHALRRQRLRNFIVLQMFSRGVPMITGGDEFGRTQNGNNNPYKLDTVATWHNYAAIATPSPTAIPTEGRGTYHDNFGTFPGDHNGWFRFVRKVIELRTNHGALRQERYGDFDPARGGDVTMLFADPEGRLDVVAPHAMQWFIFGRATGDTDFLLLVNMGPRPQAFKVGDASCAGSWKRLIDTAAWAEPLGNHWLDAPGISLLAPGHEYCVHPYSVVVFQLHERSAVTVP